LWISPTASRSRTSPTSASGSNGGFVHNPEGGYIENLDDLPWVTKVYKRDLDFRRYNVPFLKNPFISLYTSRGCPALCTFCLWPQTHSGHRWRLRSNEDVANEVKWALQNFDGLKEIFFDDDTFNYKGKRTIELCEKLGPLGFTWSCTSRVTTDYDTLKAMKEAGCRLMIVGYESGDPQILKNIKKGATVDMARRFTENAHKLGLTIHADFIVGLPGESRESLPHRGFRQGTGLRDDSGVDRPPLPGHRILRLREEERPDPAERLDDRRRRPPVAHVVYPGLDRAELVDWVERFYGEYYFRPKAAWRVVRKAIFDNKERRRLYKEAREYLALRAKRKKFVADERQASAAAGGD
jgi:hypothetical protein